MNASQENEMKTIRTSVLEIGYLDDGPKDGEPVLLLHGLPEAPAGFEKLSSRLHESGFRTIAQQICRLQCSQ
jgi:pimeloyl-ACP methyl ester carboxylesterase